MDAFADTPYWAWQVLPLLTTLQSRLLLQRAFYTISQQEPLKSFSVTVLHHSISNHHQFLLILLYKVPGVNAFMFLDHMTSCHLKSTPVDKHRQKMYFSLRGKRKNKLFHVMLMFQQLFLFPSPRAVLSVSCGILQNCGFEECHSSVKRVLK